MFTTFLFRRWKRILCFVCAVALGTLASAYVYITAQSHADYVKDPTVKCSHPDEEMAQVVNLTYQVHTILDSLGIDHWLMYGSIFGAHRANGPLPWDYDVDIGIKGEQFSKMKLTDFLAPFKVAGIEYINHFARNGLLVFEKSGWPLHVDMFTFYNYHGMRMRPGWAAWLLFVNYRLHHAFPSSLVESYMPKMTFGFFNISVPRGGVEILKYLYRITGGKKLNRLAADW